MLVIHPKDKTTAMLSALYDGLEAQVVADCCSIKKMGHLLHRVSTQERIMLLGHGSGKGLLYRADDSKDKFEIIVGHPPQTSLLYRYTIFWQRHPPAL